MQKALKEAAQTPASTTTLQKAVAPATEYRHPQKATSQSRRQGCRRTVFLWIQL